MEEQILKQYEGLRAEIRQTNSLNYQILGIVVAATAVLLTADVAQADALTKTGIFLTVYVVTIPSYRMLQGNRKHIWRISTYIRAFLEPHTVYKVGNTPVCSTRK